MNVTQDESGSGKRRSMSIDFIEQFLRQGQQGRLAALLVGKLDAFNRIATTFGRERCETFCADHAEKLRDILPPRTPIIRLSERRFAVLVDCDSMASILDYAAALTEDHPPEIEVGGDKLFVDVTLGIAVYPSHADDAETLFRRAELALTEARDKELSFDIYRPDSTQQQAALWKFESDLQGAVQRRELEVYFQPKVAIDTRRVCGVEALVRWRTPSGAFVPASDFIPLAERTGTIVAITWLVFDHVTARVAEWDALEKPFSIAVNVSPQILTHPEFTPRIKSLKAALDARGFGLTVEITEDSLVQGDESALAGVQKLRKARRRFRARRFRQGLFVARLSEAAARHGDQDRQAVHWRDRGRCDRPADRQDRDRAGAGARHARRCRRHRQRGGARHRRGARLPDGAGVLHRSTDAWRSRAGMDRPLPCLGQQRQLASSGRLAHAGGRLIAAARPVRVE